MIDEEAKSEVFDKWTAIYGIHRAVLIYWQGNQSKDSFKNMCEAVWNSATTVLEEDLKEAISARKER